MRPADPPGRAGLSRQRKNWCAKFAEEAADRASSSPLSRHIFLNGRQTPIARETFSVSRFWAATPSELQERVPPSFTRAETARMLVRDMAAGGGVNHDGDLAHYQPEDSRSSTWQLHFRRRAMGGDFRSTAKLRRRCRDRSIEHAAHVPLKGWDDPAERAHGCGSDAPRLCRSRGGTLPIRFQQCSGFGTDRFLLRTGNFLSTIDLNRASSSQEVHAGNPHVCHQGGERQCRAEYHHQPRRRPAYTTQFSVVDAAGNAVASTPRLSMTSTVRTSPRPLDSV